MLRRALKFRAARPNGGGLVGLLGGALVLLALSTSHSAFAAGSGGKVQAKGMAADSPAASKKSAVNAGSDEPSMLGLGIGFFVEDSDRTEKSQTGGQQLQEQDPEALVAASIFNVQAWYLRPFLTRGLRWGGGLAWFSSYSLEAPDAQPDDDPYVAGQMFQVGLQAEYELYQVVSKLGVVLGLRGGGALLFAGKDLQAEIDGLERLGLDVWGGPQPGLYIAPLVGVRWPLSARVNLRADLSAQFAKLWLYSGSGEAQGFTTETSAALATTRTQLLMGLDFSM